MNSRERAVCYCRCSTEEESQKNALEKQVAEAEECICNHGWLLVDSYVESRSGTTTKGRDQYKRLCADLETGKFDIIVIKSQDRLMRNTMEWHIFLDRMTKNGKKLFMYLENKFFTPDDSLVTGIKAILAEEYSRELSKKINNAHHNRQKNGRNVILTGNTYGFCKLPDKSIGIIEEEADVKRRMYELCAAGYGGRTIAEILKNDGIVNRKGRPFTDANILRMIKNPMNKGTVVMGKRHFDFDTKQTLKVPEEEWHVFEHRIPAIVSEELWERANQEIKKRAEAGRKNGVYRKNSSAGKYSLSGKLVCGCCNAVYYRTVRRGYGTGEKVFEWKCSNYLYTGRSADSGKARGQLRRVEVHRAEGCNNIHLNEEKLFRLLEDVFLKSYQPDKEKILRKTIRLLRRVLKDTDYQPQIDREKRQIEQIKKQMDVLLDKLLSGVIPDDMYQEKQSKLKCALDKSKETLLQLEKKNESGDTIKSRIDKIEQALQEGNLFEKASTASMLEEVEKIVVYPTYMEICFHTARMLGMEHTDLPDTGNSILTITYGNLFNYQGQKEEEREAIVEMMRSKPGITAKQIAEETGLSLSGVNYRIRVLKRDGRIKYQGKGGKGCWKILGDEEEPDGAKP
ncbi:MAG: recombinase family protein [Candidatus Choladocola sp.]|nr:recombinase family protein [Candidatus Choladocola sp.]